MKTETIGIAEKLSDEKIADKLKSLGLTEAAREVIEASKGLPKGPAVVAALEAETKAMLGRITGALIANVSDPEVLKALDEKILFRIFRFAKINHVATDIFIGDEAEPIEFGVARLNADGKPTVN